jgi:hypothetical protein
MATLIKRAPKATHKYIIGERIEWAESYHDGRSYEVVRYSGEIIKINPKTVTAKDTSGNIWRVEYDEIRK